MPRCGRRGGDGANVLRGGHQAAVAVASVVGGGLTMTARRSGGVRGWTRGKVGMLSVAATAAGGGFDGRVLAGAAQQTYLAAVIDRRPRGVASRPTTVLDIIVELWT